MPVNGLRAKCLLAGAGIVFTLLVAGCGKEEAPPVKDAPEPIPATSANVEGKTFLSGPGTTRGIKLLRGTQVAIDFEGQRIKAAAGCQTFVGNFEFRRSRLITSALRTRGERCEGRLAAQDRWLLSFLEKPALGQTFSGGEALILRQRANNLEMNESGEGLATNRRIERDLWEMDAIEHGSMRLRLPDDAEVPQVVFTDGVLTVMKACGMDEMPASWDESVIKLEKEIEVDVDCPQPQKIWAEAIADALNGPAEYRFRGNSLVLEGPSRNVVLTPN